MKSVLVVDDDPDIRELITWKLGQAGYSTMVAGDGEAGLAAVAAGDSEGRAPDLILVDGMMPKMSGIDVCRTLRQNPATARIPAILLTANAQEADSLGFAAGVDDYIAKPFSPRETLSRIEACAYEVRGPDVINGEAVAAALPLPSPPPVSSPSLVTSRKRNKKAGGADVEAEVRQMLFLAIDEGDLSAAAIQALSPVQHQVMETQAKNLLSSLRGKDRETLGVVLDRLGVVECRAPPGQREAARCPRRSRPVARRVGISRGCP